MAKRKPEFPVDFSSVREGLKPLNIKAEIERTGAESEYLAYYDIDFASQLEGVEHFFGYLPVTLTGGEKVKVAVHYYRLATATRTSLVVHGFTDHVGLFGQLFDYLLHRGCSVVAFDLPGHGLSEAEPLHVDSFGDYSLVFRHVLAYAQKNIGGPLNLFAQSMGAAISMDYILSQQFDFDRDPFDKVVLLAPLVRPVQWSKISISHRLLSPFLKSVPRHFNQSSNDKEFLDFQANKDPLQARRIPISWVTAMIHWVKRFRTLNWSEKPVMVIQGNKDQVVDFKYGLKLLCEKFPNAKVMRIKDARHHLVCEDENNYARVVQAADLYFERRAKSRD